MKNFFKNKKGMTYVELLVAFTLLMLIVFVFSPMLLSSYNTLYKAGEKNVDTYNAKSAIEDGLAYRNSADIIYNIQANFEDLGEMAKVNVRRVTESAAQGVASAYNNLLSSLYYNGKGYIRLISSTHINDDANCKTFVFQVSGFQINNVVYSGAPKREEMPPVDGKKYYKYTVNINVFAPAKTPVSNGGGGTYALEDTVYKTPIAADDVDLDTSALSSGIIRVTVKGVDITQSPLKLVLQYYDENNEFQEISTFIYIEAPSIILGGATATGVEYYTSAGLVTTKSRTKDASGNEIEQIERSLDIDGRDMKNVTYPTGTVIKNISWIDNDTTSQSGGFKKYYVLTGTNGAIYRLYSATDGNSYDKMKSTFNITNGEEPYSITDSGLKRTIYPVAWGGDYTHQFGFSTYGKSTDDGYTNSKGEKKSHSDKSMSYGVLGVDGGEDKWCWYTEDRIRTDAKGDKSLNGKGLPAQYDTQARYAYYYNGFRTGFSFQQQRSRRISYCLTEYGYAVRFVGNMKDADGYASYNTIWESDVLSMYYSFYIFGGPPENYESTTTRCARTQTTNNNLDEADIGYIRIKSMTNLGSGDPLFKAYDNEQTNNYTKDTSSRASDLADANAKKSVNITSAFYDPASNAMFYLGNVRSYVLVYQTDNNTNVKTGGKDTNTSNKDSSYLKTLQYDNIYKSGTGSFTAYYLETNDTCTATTIRKNSEQAGKCKTVTQNLKNSVGQSSTVITEDKKVSFFVNPTTSTSAYLFDDVLVTFGFSSNRENVYSNITYDGTKEYYKSYEPYYFISHYGDDLDNPNDVHTPTYASNGNSTNRNSYNNDYYNIWFPGEYYNLTTAVNKDGITVAVGYAVSGSTFQWSNPTSGMSQNTSTAVGGIFNDGVLAVKSDKDASFKNLLYFKDNDTFDSSSLNNTAPYNSIFGNYGTHSRQSIQFTAVDILVEGGTDAGGDVSGVSTDTKTYTAFYGDNTGRVFKSLVATAKVEYKTDDDDFNKAGGPSPVEYIADTTYSGTATPPSRMEEIKLDNGNSIKTVFSKITNIVCEGSTVIISGTRNASSTSAKSYVVVGKKSADGTWKWKSVAIASSSHIINDAAVSEGIYYACGEVGSNGFFMAVDLMDINAAIDNNTADITSHTLIADKMRTPATKIGESAATLLPKLYSIDCKGSGTD